MAAAIAVSFYNFRSSSNSLRKVCMNGCQNFVAALAIGIILWRSNLSRIQKIDSSNRLKNAFRFKYQFPYAINKCNINTCNICNNVYIGETKRHLIVRQYEHMTKSVLTISFERIRKGLLLPSGNTVLVELCGRHCNFNMMGNATNNYHLKMKESLLIILLDHH